jgi:HlyD family secretion protein
MKRILSYLRARLGWILFSVFVGLAIGGYVIYRQIQAEQARQQSLAALRAEVIGYGDIVSIVGATGAILPEQQVNLFFQAPGTVKAVLVASGDEVKAGQVLAQLDDTDLRLAVQQAADALTVAELNRQKLLAGPSASDIAVAKANLRAANANAYDLSKGAPQQEIDIAQLQYDNQFDAYQKISDQYNSAVQFAQDYPQFALPQEALDRLKANVEAAFYSAEIARLQVEQLKDSADQGALSVAYAQIVQAQVVLSQTLAPPTDLQIALADLAVEQARTALDLAELRLSRAQLTAPFDGVAAVVNIKAGEAAGTAPALVLIDTTQFHLDVTVDEVDVAQLAVGQGVSITVDALPEVTLSGKVDRLAPTAVGASGVVNYAVRLVIDSTDAPLRAGMSATAAITVAEARDVVLVPNWAIRRDRRTGQAYASLKVGDELTEVPIETGLRGEAYTEVLKGVRAGNVAAISTERERLDLFGGGG